MTEELTNIEPNDAIAIERSAQVFELRLAQVSYRAIAKALGISTSTAHGDVQREIKLRREQLGEDIDGVRALEVADLARHERTLNQKMLALGDTLADFDVYLRALGAMLKIKQRRAIVLGLDLGSEPDKVLALSINVTPDANVPLRATFVENLARSVGHPPTASDVLNDLRVKRLPEKIVDGNGRGGNGKIGG